MLFDICGTSRAPAGYYCTRDYYHRGPCAPRILKVDEVICMECREPVNKTPLKEDRWLPCEHCSLKRRMEQVDDVLTVNWIEVENNDYADALNRLIGFNMQIATDPSVNGGDTLFTKAECKLLHTLVDGYVVGTDVRKVLDKLKVAAL